MIMQANLGAPAGRSYDEKASTLSDLSDEAIDVLVAYGSACTSPWSQILIQHVHGAATRVDPTKTAFVLRGESYVICMLAAWDDGEVQRHRAWTHACWRAIEPFGNSGVYVNFLGNEGEGRIRASYGVQPGTDLRDLKRDRGLAGGAWRKVPWQQDEGSGCGSLRHHEGNQPRHIGCIGSSTANGCLIGRNSRPTILQADVITRITIVRVGAGVIK